MRWIQMDSQNDSACVQSHLMNPKSTPVALKVSPSLLPLSLQLWAPSWPPESPSSTPPGHAEGRGGIGVMPVKGGEALKHIKRSGLCWGESSVWELRRRRRRFWPAANQRWRRGNAGASTTSNWDEQQIRTSSKKWNGAMRFVAQASHLVFKRENKSLTLSGLANVQSC